MTGAAAVERLEAAGVRVLWRHAPAHEIVAVRLYVRGGATRLDAARAGAEAMYARVARRGTARFPKERLNAELAARGIELAAAASDDFTVFNVRCLARHFERAWELLADIVRAPLLLDEDMTIVRRQMLLELGQLRDSPDGALAERARAVCYRGHAYAPDPHGTPESVAALDAAALRQHMARQLVRSNLLVVVAGNVGREALVRRVEADLGPLPAGDGPAPPPPPLAYAAGALHIEARDLPTNYVLGQFAAPSLADPEYHATLVGLSVLRDRFFEEVRTRRNLSYAPAASLGHDAANLGSVYVSTTDPRAALAVMRAEMRRLQHEPLEAGELGDKIRVFVTRYHLHNETLHAQAGFLASHEILAGAWEASRDFVARIEALAPADVQRAARAVLRNIQYVYLGDAAAADAVVIADP